MRAKSLPIRGALGSAAPLLHNWFNCLAAATATLTCCRCLELGLLQTCAIWWRYEFLVGGWQEFEGGAAYDIKVRKKHTSGPAIRPGWPKFWGRNYKSNDFAQTREAMTLLGTQPGPFVTVASTAASPVVTVRRSSLA